MCLGEKGHRVDNFAKHHRRTLGQQHEEPAAHRVDSIGAPAGIEDYLDIGRERDLGGENPGEALNEKSRAL